MNYDQSEAFLRVVRQQGWLRPEHEQLLKSNPGQPWVVLASHGILTEAHIHWAFGELARQQAQPTQTTQPAQAWGATQQGQQHNNWGAQSAAPKTATTNTPKWGGADKKAATPAQPQSAWGATKNQPAPARPVPVPATPARAVPVEQPNAAGNIAAAVPATPVHGQGHIAPAVPADHIKNQPVVQAVSGEFQLAELTEPEKQLVERVVSCGFGAEAYIKTRLAMRSELRELLGLKRLSPLRTLVESATLTISDIQQLSQSAPELKLEHEVKGLQKIYDPSKETSLQIELAEQKLDPDSLDRARELQNKLRDKGIDRSLISLIQLCQQNKRPSTRQRRKTTSSRRPRAPRAPAPTPTANRVESEPGAPIFLAVFVFALCFLGTIFATGAYKKLLIERPDSQPTRKKTAQTNTTNQQPNYHSDPNSPTQQKTDTDPGNKLAADSTVKVVNQQPIDPSPENNKPDEEPVVQDDQTEKADQAALEAKRQEAAALKLANAHYLDTREALLSVKLTEPGRLLSRQLSMLNDLTQHWKSAKRPDRQAQAQFIRRDVEQFSAFFNQELPKLIDNKDIPPFQLKQYGTIEVRLIGIDSNRFKLRLAGGAQAELDLSDPKQKNNLFRILMLAPAKTESRFAIASMAWLYKEKQLSQTLYAELWHQFSKSRAEILLRYQFWNPEIKGLNIKNGQLCESEAAEPEPDSRPDSQQQPPAKVNPAIDRPIIERLVAACRGRQSQFELLWTEFAQQNNTELTAKDQKKLVSALKLRLRSLESGLKKYLNSESKKKVNSNEFKELQSRRKRALQLIFDSQKYPRKAGPQAQAAVDELVQSVRVLWLKSDPLATPKSKQVLSAHAHVLKCIQSLDSGFKSQLDQDALTQALFYFSGLRKISPAGRVRDNTDYDLLVLAYNDRQHQLPKETRQLSRELNEYRIMLGLPALALSKQLVQASTKHSKWMLSSGIFSHDSNVPGSETPKKRAKNEGYRALSIAENIYRGSESASDAQRAWYNSAGHHRNMLSRTAKEMGAAQIDGFWTEMFGDGRPDLR